MTNALKTFISVTEQDKNFAFTVYLILVSVKEPYTELYDSEYQLNSQFIRVGSYYTIAKMNFL